MRLLTPTLATACAALPPARGVALALPVRGARFTLGRPGGETQAPTLATACAALPPARVVALAVPVRGARFTRADNVCVSTVVRPGGETQASRLQLRRQIA